MWVLIVFKCLIHNVWCRRELWKLAYSCHTVCASIHSGHYWGKHVEFMETGTPNKSTHRLNFIISLEWFGLRCVGLTCNVPGMCVQQEGTQGGYTEGGYEHSGLCFPMRPVFSRSHGHTFPAVTDWSPLAANQNRSLILDVTFISYFTITMRKATNSFLLYNKYAILVLVSTVYMVKTYTFLHCTLNHIWWFFLEVYY